jgi:hypothetical protein
VLPSEQKGCDDDEEEEEEEEGPSCEDGDEDDEEEEDKDLGGRLSTTMATTALSPIREGEGCEEATCETAPRTGETRLSIPPPGSTAPTPRRDAANICTPRSAQHDISIDSAPSIVPEEKSRSSKSITVNGVAYSQIHTIGRGGSSKVYLVHTPEGKSVALKRVTTDSLKQLEAFENEVDLLLRLRGQENVIQVLDAEVDRERGRILIVMEAADMDLGRFLQSEPRLSLRKVQNIWRQMLQSVQVIHKARIVHSDLKPGNFVLVGGKLKVIDFGIAKSISNDTTNISRDASVGTLSYMAPEAVKHGTLKLGRSSDIWSLGIILYQIVYKHPPFAHLEPIERLFMLNKPDLRIEFPDGHCLDDHSSTTKAQLVDILEGCLQRDARRRPSLEDLLAHPFLRSTVEVQREDLDGVVATMMSQVVEVLGQATQASEAEVARPASEWQVLADEVWENISGTRDAARREASDFAGLAPASAVALHCAHLRRERDSARDEAQREKARNADLEEQLSRLTQRAAVGTAHDKELKENFGVAGKDITNISRGVSGDGKLDSSLVPQRLKTSR